MIVYRYENENERGPYASCGVLDMFMEHNAAASEPGTCQPAARVDFNTTRIPLWARFGCPSIQALNTWFRGWEIDLEKAGYHVAIYEVADDDVQIGASGLQCLFDCRHAVRLEF